MKRGCLISLIALIAIVCLALGLVSVFLFTTPALLPSVQINSPRHGEQVAVGQGTLIQALARDAQKIRRVELWVDGQLLDAQTTNLPGGISPFPIVTPWQARTSGNHTIVVRAFNTIGGRGQATIVVNAADSADRDHDGIPDARDACPDQPGLPAARGCPAPSATDRDGDGVADSADACPDQPGTSLAQGCPDADSDGVRDSADACPREPGTGERNGCPAPGDTDSDGIADASDACPREPGSAGARGCPDSDSDGVADREDACADAPGAPGLGGCPDRDGDGVRDPLDLCPDVPGPASNAGCPPTGTGDRDGDGVDDGTDLAPGDAGSADSGGAPPPGGDGGEADGGVPGAHRSDDEVPGERGPFPDMGGEEAVNLVRLDALEFSVTQDYDRVYCYAGVVGRGMERIGPFNPLGERQWDIAAYAGGANSRTFGIPVGQALQLRVECMGVVGTGTIGAVYSMGSLTRSYDQSQWDGHVIAELSGATSPERGEPGHSFLVKFRLCLRSCDAAAFPPPHLTLQHLLFRRYLHWTWEGNRRNITGFILYVNGNRRATIRDANANRFNLHAYMPACSETNEYYVTAYRIDESGIRRESPPSNSIRLRGATCPRQVKVTFALLWLAPNTPDDFGPDGGPFYGTFWANGINEQRLEFRTGECHSFRWIYNCRTGWQHRMEGSIANIFAGIRNSSPELSGWNMYAPQVDYVIVELGREDDLTIGVNIMDEDVYSHDDTMLNAQQTFRAGETLPGEVTLQSNHSFVVVRIEEMGAP